MKKIKVVLPVLALLVAIVASAFTMPHAKRASNRKNPPIWLQQDAPGTVLWTSPYGPQSGYKWTDVTDSVTQPILYSDEAWHCTLSSNATCILQEDQWGNVLSTYNGISVLF